MRAIVAVSLILAAGGQVFGQDYPITSFPWGSGKSEETCFGEMRQKVAALEAEAGERFGLELPIQKELGWSTSKSWGRTDHDDIAELVSGIVHLPLEDFVASISPERWGVDLADYMGGDHQLRPRGPKGHFRQLERMVLKNTSKWMESGLKHLDMTKLEEIVWEWDGNELVSVTVHWEVYASDNATVAKDVGFLRFSRGSSRQTRVTTLSAHKYEDQGIFPSYIPKSWKPTLLGMSLKSYFKKVRKKYARVSLIRTAKRRLAGEATPRFNPGKKRGMLEGLTETQTTR